MKMPPPLTGDFELDTAVPYRPRVLPEITWIPLSATKTLAAGSLNATVLPSQLRGTSLIAVLHKLDGSNTLDTLIDGQNQAQHEMRRFLRLLFQAGLIEDGSDTIIPDGSAFYALSMDQTRLHRNRKDALESSRRPIRMLGISSSMLRIFRLVGINSADESSSELPAFQLLMLNPDGCPIDESKVSDDVPVLPIRLHDNAIDIGPWLSPKAGCTVSDLQEHIIQEASNSPVTGNIELLEAFCVHGITLLLAGTSPFVMAATLYRLHNNDAGPYCEKVAVSRLANQRPDAAPALRKKLLDRAQSTMPAMRHVGTKAYEAHYLPRNLIAALEIQEGGYAPVSTIPGSQGNASSRILNLLSSVFGYKTTKSGQLRRNCPSGGNLGSPEPLLWCSTTGVLRAYRYIPLLNQLECVYKTTIENVTADEAGILCLGNREKLHRKYDHFAGTLTCLDGGISRAFFETVAKSECIDLQHLHLATEVPAALNQLVADRKHHYIQLWAFKLQPLPEIRAMLPDKIAERIRLSNIIKNRRSVRVFSDAGVTLERYAQLIHESRTALSCNAKRNLVSHITPIIRVRGADDQCFYLMDGEGTPRYLCSKSTAPELFLQRTLDNAPFAFFLTSNLFSFLEHREEKDLDALISGCGQWLGTLWLLLPSLGLGGCPCGAAVEMDLQAILPSDYRNHSLLASFVSGRPMS